MIWHYRCPECGQKLEVDWDWHLEEVHCPNCKNDHYPPTPNEDPSAYFAGDRWPKELEDAVIGLRGTTCDVPTCYREYGTLIHRKPVSKGGVTSVDNLIPVCSPHAHTKGEQEYNEWIAAIKDEDPAPQPKFEIEFTDAGEEKPEPPPVRHVPPPPPPRPARGASHTLAAHADMPDNHPAGMHLIKTVPFMSGAAQRLVLNYDLTLKHEGGCQVILAAWQVGEEPDMSKGLEGLTGLQASRKHEGKAGDRGTGKLELALPSDEDGMWVCAILLTSEQGRPEIGNYVLQGIE
jgi:hypothetical protein